MNIIEKIDEERRIDDLQLINNTSVEPSNKFSRFVNLFKQRSQYNSFKNIGVSDIKNHQLPKPKKINYNKDEFDMIEWVVSNNSLTKTRTGNQISWEDFDRKFIYRIKNFHMMDYSLEFFQRTETSIKFTAKKHLQNLKKLNSQSKIKIK